MSQWKELNTLQDVAEAQAAGMEIETTSTFVQIWSPWHEKLWDYKMLYRARPRKPEVETFDDQIDAARYRWLKNNRATSLIINLFGNGCVNKTFADVEAVIDNEIGDTKKPAKVQVKSLCWRGKGTGHLVWWDALANPGEGFVRFPAGDIPGEIEE